MTAEEIAQIILALVQALPELMALFTKGGGDAQSIITKYGVDQAVFRAAIAAAQARGK